MNNVFKLDIISNESIYYSNYVKRLTVVGLLGEMQILFNHIPLITLLSIGPLWFLDKDNKLKTLIILGGILEVQPKCTKVLADTIIRSEKIDKAAELEAKKNKQELMGKKLNNVDYSKLKIDLAITLAKLKLLDRIKIYKK